MQFVANVLDLLPGAAYRRAGDEGYPFLSVTPAIERLTGPAAEIAALEDFCVGEMTKHFRKVAAQMAPAQGERYLAVVLPRIAGHSHQGAPNVRVTP